MSTRKSLFFSFLDRYASLAISVASSMVIARLLTPAEIGVFSVTMVLLIFVNTVRDMGAGQYLVQEKELTTERIRAVWAVQLGLGLGLACVVLLVSYPVAVFYQEPRMRDILLVVALTYAINPFGSLTNAWLAREMLFQNLAIMRFSAVLTGALVAAYLAWKSYGPISLAYGSLASTVVTALVAIYFRPKSFPWLPGISEIRRVLTFGSKLTGSTFISSLAGSAPELFLGKLQSFTSVGLYSRANGLVQMFYRLFVDSVAAVCLPWFARQSREGKSIAEPFLKATSYVTAFGWSFCIALICLAHPVVRLLYGDQWDQSVDLSRLLALAIAISVPVALCGAALLSLSAINAVARASVFSSLQSILFIAIGASQGILLLGIAMILAAAFNAAIWFGVTSKHIGIPIHSFVRTLRESMVVALMSGIGPMLALWIYGPYPNVLVMPLSLGVVGGLAGFVIGILVFKHPLQEEIIPIWLKIKQLAV